jgi:alpha-beta hydrolase superfamily lysophospholipase
VSPSNELVTANRTRAVGAGIDPNQYEHVAGQLELAGDWTSAFAQAAREHRRRGDAALARVRDVSAGEAYLAAARWWHFATTWPNPDRGAHNEAVAESAAAYGAALAQLDPQAHWIDRRAAAVPFTGVLRRPVGVSDAPLVLIVPGLDSGKEEFHYVAQALLARGVATFAFDGPGQGELSAQSTIEADYDRVVAHVLDTLADEHGRGVDLQRIGAIALSLGGFYGIKAAATDKRIRALATVSGVCSLPWDLLPQGVIDTLVQRCGSEEAARDFAAGVDAQAAAGGLDIPLLVVAGGQDPIPTPAEAARVADVVPNAELFLVAEGDHLLANTQWRWLGAACDWLADRLA